MGQSQCHNIQGSSMCRNVRPQGRLIVLPWQRGESTHCSAGGIVRQTGRAMATIPLAEIPRAAMCSVRRSHLVLGGGHIAHFTLRVKRPAMVGAHHARVAVHFAHPACTGGKESDKPGTRECEELRSALQLVCRWAEHVYHFGSAGGCRMHPCA